ncbi:hypothetical protein [Stenoxybacter acetivorans]|nr:hypothetical protein [Stenoxybacter acetivorans]
MCAINKPRRIQRQHQPCRAAASGKYLYPREYWLPETRLLIIVAA